MEYSGIYVCNVMYSNVIVNVHVDVNVNVM